MQANFVWEQIPRNHENYVVFSGDRKIINKEIIGDKGHESFLEYDMKKEGREKMQTNLAWDQIPKNHKNYLWF
jgi:hypothetical protein